LALGIGPGDEVIIPSFTMIASAFAVCYTGAMPVFADVDSDTWNIDVSLVEAKITKRTKAIMPVHVFGTPCDMDGTFALSEEYGLYVIEDAAEAHGAEYKGKKAGSFSHASAFSFFSNKNLATGEGGMVLTNDESVARRARYFKNLCFSVDGPRTYTHEDIGYNYRMTNVHAAIGLAQVERANYYRELRIKNHQLYKQLLQNIPGITFQHIPEDTLSVHWMNSILIDESKFGVSRDQLMFDLKEVGIDTRLVFTGMHKQTALRKYGCEMSGSYPVTDRLSESGMYLPSASHLTSDDIRRVCEEILNSRKK